jgi:outer membrane lipoprotein-sorting protein
MHRVFWLFGLWLVFLSGGTSLAFSVNQFLEDLNHKDKLSVLSPDHAPPTDHQKIVKATEAWLNKLTSMQADIVQHNPDGTTSEGRFWMKRPHQLRWDYGDAGTPLVSMVVNHDHWIVLDHPTSQMTRGTVDHAVASLLVSPAIRFGENVNVLDVVEREGIWHLWLAKSGSLPEETLTLRIRLSPWEWVGMDIEDRDHQRTVIDFHHVRYDVPIDHGLFTLEDPRLQPQHQRRSAR